MLSKKAAVVKGNAEQLMKVSWARMQYMPRVIRAESPFKVGVGAWARALSTTPPPHPRTRR